MGEYATLPLTDGQYKELIEMMRIGSSRGGFRKNLRISEVLIAQANLGLRISDIIKLKPSDFIYTGQTYEFDKEGQGFTISGDVYKINIVEQKTGKKRFLPVPGEYYKQLQQYIKDNNIGRDELIFPIKPRSIQQYLKKVCDYLGPEYDLISTHSFRKYCGMKIYIKSGYNILAPMTLYGHSSPAITKRYLHIESKEMESLLISSSHLV